MLFISQMQLLMVTEFYLLRRGKSPLTRPVFERRPRISRLRERHAPRILLLSRLQDPAAMKLPKISDVSRLIETMQAHPHGSAMLVAAVALVGTYTVLALWLVR